METWIKPYNVNRLIVINFINHRSTSYNISILILLGVELDYLLDSVALFQSRLDPSP